MNNVEMLLGSLLIFIYASERFNTPRSTRSCTTALRYYCAMLAYLLVYLLAYYFLSKYPVLLNFLIPENDPELQIFSEDASTAILVALILALLVPKVPMISELDVRLRRFLHRLALIPYEVIRMSKDIQSREFTVPEAIRDQVQEEAISYGLSSEQNTSDLKSWNKIAALMIELRQWEVENPFSIFVHEREIEFRRLQDRYSTYSSLLANSIGLNKQIQDQPGMLSLQETANRLQQDLKQEHKKIMADIADFIAQASLTHCFRANSRALLLEKLGFEKQEKIVETGLSIHKNITLAGIMLVLLLISFTLFTREMINIERMMVRTSMIVAIYMSVVAWAVYPKVYWPWFRHEQGDFYPVAAYVVAGILAALTAMSINLFFNTLILLAGDNANTLGEAINMAWARFSTQSYPWLVMPLVTTVTLCLLVDLNFPDKISPLAGRIIKGGALALVMMLTSALVRLWLAFIIEFKQIHFIIPPLLTVQVVSATVGLLLGYFIPAWFVEPRKTVYEDLPEQSRFKGEPN
jgi:hypothetical protein